jgi:hypothetical protein
MVLVNSFCYCVILLTDGKFSIIHYLSKVENVGIAYGLPTLYNDFILSIKLLIKNNVITYDNFRVDRVVPV